MPRADAEFDSVAGIPEDDRGFAARASVGSLATSLAFALGPVAGLATVWTLAAMWWPTLPAKIPLHFDAAGVPDRWGPASVANWFMLPFIATWITAMIGGIAIFLPSLARHWPGIVNVPQKKRWVALPPEERIRTAEPIRWMLGLVGLLANALFVWILWGTRWVAMDPDPANPSRTLGGLWPVLAMTGLLLVAVLLASLRMRTLVLRATEASSEANGSD
ncbi:MAG: DUF1648 domain-containing protein [Phycisphaerales bacterium]